MSAVAVVIRPTANGWSVCFTDGRPIAEYRGPFSKQRALRYLQRYMR
jgi:hypothetical protein